MREIKFRAWHKKYKYMARVADISFNRGIVNLNAADISKIEDIELMQYTGKKDKNGTEIFEHDLIQLDGTPYIYEIMWDNESSSYKMQNKNDTFEWDVLELRTFKTPYITVLGNIYENKELLEGKEK